MNARLVGLMFSFLTLAAWAGAQGMYRLTPEPVYQSEGRDPLKFAVTCATATWTLVVSSDTISRSTFIESIAANTQPVCLYPARGTNVAPTVAVSSQCISVTQGPELAPNSELTDYSHAAWYCAASSGTTSQSLKGYRTRDNNDAGEIADPSNQ